MQSSEGQSPRADIQINEQWCKKCGICSALCPKGVLTGGKDVLPCATAPEKCTFCRLCEFRCPDFAIRVEGDEQHGK